MDHNLKVDYQTLIIFGTTISDTVCHKRLLKFPNIRHLTYVSALPGEIKTHKIGIKINKNCQKPFVTLLIVTWRRIVRF